MTMSMTSSMPSWISWRRTRVERDCLPRLTVPRGRRGVPSNESRGNGFDGTGERLEAKRSWEVSLPIYSKMNDHDVEDVIGAVLDIVEKNAL